ncbi:MAG TPA: glycosyltransferase [Solirubrobacteraceae bacterium]|nr:glycosyltransferase [Solirubrobacteraceae bacterium]
MKRPEVSVVMPFGGQPRELAGALEALGALDAGQGDELMLADNSGVLLQGDLETGAVRVVPALGERSPARARNAGAAQASRDWILFLDADCRPLPGLLDAYFRIPIADDVGALAGEVVAAQAQGSLSSRYGAARNFLSQEAHLAHPYLPRAAAANLLVRRAAFVQVGGFYEGLRAAEDTDFTWRLQRAGWRIELRSRARVEHHYRGSLRELRRQWRSYAAGRAWLARRYEGFEPQPAVARSLRRALVRVRRPGRTGGTGQPSRAGEPQGWAQPASFRALDVVLAMEELAGLVLPNRPVEATLPSAGPVDVVLVVDEFPREGDPLVELAASIDRARIEAVARPEAPDLEAGRTLSVRYLEDEGVASRTTAALSLALRHPFRVAADLLGRGPREPTVWDLAPAVRRLQRDPQARLHPLGGRPARALAQRLGRLAGRSPES